MAMSRAKILNCPEILDKYIGNTFKYSLNINSVGLVGLVSNVCLLLSLPPSIKRITSENSQFRCNTPTNERKKNTQILKLCKIYANCFI